jgi:hypothetical protein
MPTTESTKIGMRYFGVKCATCEEPIPLAICDIDEGRKITFYVVPVTPLPCPVCGSSNLYASPDAIYFDGPDDLLSHPEMTISRRNVV